jgi:CHAT domain-containing protein
MPLRIPRSIKRVAGALAITVAVVGAAYWYAITPHRPSAPPESAESVLYEADTLSWGNRWEDALPFYRKAQQLFLAQHNSPKALYAEVSQIPPDESVNITQTILRLDRDLAKPEAQDPETRLRILTIRGMLEINYDAGRASSTWKDVETLALHLHHPAEATRAEGEQGIAAFILGNTDTAKTLVLRAWLLSKVERDPGATVRYASIFGAGLVQLHRYKEALTPLNDAIKLAASRPDVAYPTIAVYSKIEALDGLRQYDQAYQLANESLARLQGTRYEGHKSQVYIDRGSVNRDRGDWGAAISDYQHAVEISTKIDNFRGVTDAGGLLAAAYVHTGDLRAALAAINTAIDANTKNADELYLVPRNLAIKADITARLGDMRASNVLYQKSITLVEGMIQHAPTTAIQRYLLAEMSDVYSGYFAALCSQHHYDEALQALERVRGRIEAEALEHHENQPIHAPTPAEEELTRLNLALINTQDTAQRASITSAIYSTELAITPSSLTKLTIQHPVRLPALQASLSANAVLIEYVLAEPHSYALAVTHESVTSYQLPSKTAIESEADHYRNEIRARKVDLPLAQKLFTDLLGPVKEYPAKRDLIVVPDGSLHLLPFAALADHDSYLLKSHTVDVAPSSTVYVMLDKRVNPEAALSLPFVGVAAWTQPADTRNPIVRAISGPERSQLAPLPDSRLEVETIAGDLPKPSTILLGADATESRFKKLALNKTEVVHLALHGYADLEYPDRSALIFAPDPTGAEDGLLQVREVRHLHLNAKLVTLSACNTGVGPVGQAGVANLVNAFIEAGADSVVSTLWDLEDHSTEYLMSLFYAQLARHTRKVDALRTAQLVFLNRGLAPYFWAGVQIVGDADGNL